MSDLSYAARAEAVLAHLHTSSTGLTDEEVRTRRQKYGSNILPHKKARTDLEILEAQFANPLLILLGIAWVISLVLHHYADAAFIGVFVLVNTAVGFWQERKASRAFEELRSLIAISARVTRDRERLVVVSEALVPGDIVSLAPGDKVSADMRLISVRDLRVDESALTGEWLAVSKSLEAVAIHAPLAERSCMAFMGTVVEGGEGVGVVVATGADTEIGYIAGAASERVRPTPLQERLAHLARIATALIILVIVVIVAVGLLRGQEPGETFVAALALAVSAIPANLLPALTLILSFGMIRSFKRRALVRRLAAGETLGSVTVICTDKTGTLTLGKMEVSRTLAGDELIGGTVPEEDEPTETLRIHALERASLGCDAFIENPTDATHEWRIRGRATEAALVVEGQRQGIDKRQLESVHEILDRAVFSSATKYSATLRRAAGGSFLSVVGAPEIVADMCTSIRLREAKTTLTKTARKKLAAETERLAASGLRLVAIATKEYKKRPPAEEMLGKAPEKLTLIGIVALRDPLRADARASVLAAERAGIRTVLITGDLAATALSIAKEVGIEARIETLLLGSDIEKLSDEQLEERVRDVTIYARVSPEHKLRIVRALQKRQEVVAMVGDGVNDAPALRAADVGIAVGSGTDIAKEAADMVLLDDSFTSIVSAVEEGRLMFRNVRKVFAYLIGDDLAELSLFFGAFLVGLPLPLLPVQILWINLVEDALPVAGLAAEEDRTGVMDERPRRRNEPIVDRALRRWLLAVFGITGAASFFSFVLFLHATGGLAEARSMIFTLLALDSLIFALSVRSFEQPLWRKDILGNRALSSSLAIGVLLTLAALYLPPLSALLGTSPLSLPELLLVCFISLIEIVLIEGYKKLYFGRSERIG